MTAPAEERKEGCSTNIGMCISCVHIRSNSYCGHSAKQPHRTLVCCQSVVPPLQIQIYQQNMLRCRTQLQQRHTCSHSATLFPSCWHLAGCGTRSCCCLLRDLTKRTPAVPSSPASRFPCVPCCRPRYKRHLKRSGLLSVMYMVTAGMSTLMWCQQHLKARAVCNGSAWCTRWVPHCNTAAVNHPADGRPLTIHT